jgi:hypothetical protein
MFHILSDYKLKYKYPESIKYIIDKITSTTATNLINNTYHGSYRWKLKYESLLDYYMNLSIITFGIRVNNLASVDEPVEESQHNILRLLGKISRALKLLMYFIGDAELSDNKDFFVVHPKLPDSALLKKMKEPLEPYIYLHLLINT